MDKEQIMQAIQDSREEFIADWRTVMQVESVRAEAAPGAPFGVGPRKMLDVVCALGTKYGFETRIVNDAMAIIQWGSDNDDYVGIIGHMDVVAAGTGWHYDPFDLTEVDGRFYGRGVLDSKGPSMANLFGMKLLKDLGYQPAKTIRIVLGSDEESGSGDIPMYLAAEPAPAFGYTPDCKYPPVYGERGIVDYDLRTHFAAGELDAFGDISGEMNHSFVPDNVGVTINGQDVRATGKKSPSNAPEMGDNALTKLAVAITDQGLLDGSAKDYFAWIAGSLHNQHFGEGVGIAFSDTDSGKLILTPHTLVRDGDDLVLSIAMRYPVTVTEEQVTDGLAANVPANTTLSITRSYKSVLHDKNDPRVIKLGEIYEDLTGFDGTPVTTTGATYARSMPNIIAFGPSFPGQKGIAHKEDEWMDEKDIMMNMAIYMNALVALSSEKG